MNRVLDMLDIELDADLFPRWQRPGSSPRAAARAHQAGNYVAEEEVDGEVVP